MGAGRVDLSKAARASFVLNETYANYMAANPATGGDVKTLNLASFGNASCVQQCSWVRTLTSVLTTTAQYTASVSAPAGVTVTVTPANFTLGAGASRVITVTVNVGTSAIGTWKFAQVNLDGGPSLPASHFPVAVKPSAGSLPDKLDITTPRDSGFMDFSVTSLAVTTLTHQTSGLIPAINYTGVLTGDSHNSSWFDDLTDGVQVFTVTMTTNDVRLHGANIATTASDMDLYLYKETNGNGHLDSGDLLVAQSATSSALESVDVITNTGGTYYFVLQNWEAGPNPPDHYTFEIAKVAKTDVGNTTLLGPTSAAGGTPYTLTLTYNEPQMDAGENWYGLLTLGTDPGNPGNIGQIPINVHRVADEVSKSVSPATAKLGDVVTYTIVIKNPDAVPHNYVLTDVLPASVTYVPGSVAGPATYNAGLNAIQISQTVNGQVKAANYVVDNSLTNPNLVNESPLGGFYSLANFGAPSARLDDTLYSYADVGCPFQFYDSANSTPNGFQYSTNGVASPRSALTSVPGPVPAPIPTAANPNGFIAADWNNVSISNTLGITTAGRLGFTLYNTAPVCPSDYLWAFEYHRLHDKTNAGRVMDVQYLYDFANPDVHWVQYGNVSGSWGTASGDVLGMENPAGSLGVAYTGPITSNLVLKYYRPQVSAPPITVTFQVTVTSGGVLPIVNSATYTVNVLHTAVMYVDAILDRVLNKVYLPIILR
jgi:uncharacterized repeat protein (TIGR01451 family)